jgi:hypothetical protein
VFARQGALPISLRFYNQQIENVYCACCKVHAFSCVRLGKQLLFMSAELHVLKLVELSGLGKVPENRWRRCSALGSWSRLRWRGWSGMWPGGAAQPRPGG